MKKPTSGRIMHMMESHEAWRNNMLVGKQAYFNNMDLRDKALGSVLNKYDYHHAIFRDSDLSGVTFDDVYFADTEFSNCKLKGTRFVECHFNQCRGFDESFFEAIFANMRVGDLESKDGMIHDSIYLHSSAPDLNKRAFASLCKNLLYKGGCITINIDDYLKYLSFIQGQN